MLINNDLDVVIPARGDEKWFNQCLESLNLQICQPGRIIVIDDGLSQPNDVMAMGKDFFGSRFLLADNAGFGISSALNTGIGISHAKWIGRMDADDVAYPNRFSKQLSYLQKHPSHIGCGSQCILIDANGNSLGSTNHPLDEPLLKKSLIQSTCFTHPTLVMLRGALLDNPYRTVFDGAEDVDLILRLIRTGRITNLPDILLKYRIHTKQHNFINRAQQTALQELCFRLERLHRSNIPDPICSNPDLVEEFITWRLGQKGYPEARNILTAGRYLLAFMAGRSYKEAFRAFKRIYSLSTSCPFALYHSIQLARKGVGSLALENSPFVELNTRH
jgi:glycosyltransferase involved in cell wall biosynthesis